MEIASPDENQGRNDGKSPPDLSGGLVNRDYKMIFKEIASPDEKSRSK
jgi:hypothetical protein